MLVAGFKILGVGDTGSDVRGGGTTVSLHQNVQVSTKNQAVSLNFFRVRLFIIWKQDSLSQCINNIFCLHRFIKSFENAPKKETLLLSE